LKLKQRKCEVENVKKKNQIISDYLLKKKSHWICITCS